MDLSIKIGDTLLYIRVAALVRSPKGYIFEKSKYGYIYPIGGKMKSNEFSFDAVKREIYEEIAMKVNKISLVSVLENMFTEEEKVHEICFIYKVEEEFTGTLPDGFIEVSENQMSDFDIKPTPIINLLKDEFKNFKHLFMNSSTGN